MKGKNFIFMSALMLISFNTILHAQDSLNVSLGRDRRQLIIILKTLKSDPGQVKAIGKISNYTLYVETEIPLSPELCNQGLKNTGQSSPPPDDKKKPPKCKIIRDEPVDVFANLTADAFKVTF